MPKRASPKNNLEKTKALSKGGQPVSEAGAAIAYRSREALGISGVEIARYLGATFSINRILPMPMMENSEALAGK